MKIEKVGADDYIIHASTLEVKMIFDGLDSVADRDCEQCRFEDDCRILSEVGDRRDLCGRFALLKYEGDGKYVER